MVKGAGRTLTVAEGAAMISGTGIGSGVMAIPCLIKSAGVIGGLLAFAAAFALSAVMHCLTADMVINSGEYEIPRIFSCLLPPGKRKRQAELLFFVLTALMLDDSSTAPTGVSYDKSTNTLTLENAELSTPYSGNVNYAMHAAVIYSTGNLTIDLVGSSTITYSTSGEATYLAGIVNTGGNLKFTGSGSLTIKNGIDAAGNNKRYYGICSYGALTVDNPTITIDAEKTMTCAEECGVLVAGAFAIEKGTVTIRTWNTTTSSNIW